MNKKHAELEGKTFFWEYSLYPLVFMVEQMGLVATPDNTDPAIPLVERFVNSKADVALWSVFTSEQGEEILSLPKDVQKKFLILKNRFASRYENVANMYQKIEDAKIVSLYEHWTPDFEKNFASAFLQILAK